MELEFELPMDINYPSLPNARLMSHFFATLLLGFILQGEVSQIEAKDQSDSKKLTSIGIEDLKEIIADSETLSEMLNPPVHLQHYGWFHNAEGLATITEEDFSTREVVKVKVGLSRNDYVVIHFQSQDLEGQLPTDVITFDMETETYIRWRLSSNDSLAILRGVSDLPLRGTRTALPNSRFGWQGMDPSLQGMAWKGTQTGRGIQPSGEVVLYESILPGRCIWTTVVMKNGRRLSHERGIVHLKNPIGVLRRYGTDPSAKESKVKRNAENEYVFEELKFAIKAPGNGYKQISEDGISSSATIGFIKTDTTTLLMLDVEPLNQSASLNSSHAAAVIGQDQLSKLHGYSNIEFSKITSESHDGISYHSFHAYVEKADLRYHNIFISRHGNRYSFVGLSEEGNAEEVAKFTRKIFGGFRFLKD